KVGAAAWILAGAAHHSVYTQQIDVRHIEAFCEMADVELVVIDADTKLRSFKNELRLGEVAFK
ncbi:MAG: L-arabinose isomerase, partial [Pontiellaceae bacterium]|nr:L-arabinose isomerase [Pontiellaceae bacterium]